MNDLTLHKEEEKRKGFIFSIFFHVLIILLLFIPFMQYQVPPPGQPGILVSFGLPEQGQGDDRPDTQDEEEEVQPEEQQVQNTTPKSAEAPKEILTTTKESAVTVQKREAERQRQLEAEIAAAEAEAAEKARQEEYSQTKKQFGSLLGKGRGETDNVGNQGDPQGDPNASNLSGISTGSGRVGGGLSGRGLIYEPEVNDNSQKTGRVVINICVDQTGQVISAQYTQRNSTTADAYLKDLAERNARKFRFNPSQVSEQCGTITFDFKLR